jgi:hypothetical protein
MQRLHRLAAVCGNGLAGRHSLIPHGRALHKPTIILTAQGIEWGWVVGGRGDGKCRGAASPFVDFGMAISKGNSASSAVIGGWRIPPETGAIRIIQEVAIVDAVSMFINGHKEPGWLAYKSELQPLTVVGEEVVASLSPGASGIAAIWAEKGVHGHAPHPAGPPAGALRCAGVVVGRALVNAEIAAEVTGQNAVLDQECVGVHGVGAPTHHIVDPVSEGIASDFGSRFDHSEIVGDPVFIVIRVHHPAEHELLRIVEATDGLRPAPSPAQSRQKHAREDRDDGDDDQEFNQGES